jgi:hypothetical protein
MSIVTKLILSTTLYLIAIILVGVLSGCSELKLAECIARDSTRNPCN